MASLSPTEQWGIREKLCLASSVMRTGDQNWVTVSRAIKPFAEPPRHPDFFSQKNCALQYSVMLENAETPKRKRSNERGDAVETPGDLIVRKMHMERMDELKAQIREDKARFKQLKKEIAEIRSGALDDKLPTMWNDVQTKKAAVTEEESKVTNTTTEEDKSVNFTTASTSGKARQPSSHSSKPSRTSEGSSGEPTIASVSDKQPECADSDLVFDSTESSAFGVLSSILAEKQKADAEKQEAKTDSTGVAEGCDIDVTAVTNIAKTPSIGVSTLSKLLTQRGKSPPSGGCTSPGEAPGTQQPHLSAVAKATAAKEAAKILLSGRGACAEGISEVCGSRGFQNVFSSFVKSEKHTDPKTDNKSGESKETAQEPSAEVKPSVEERESQAKKPRGRPPKLKLKLKVQDKKLEEDSENLPVDVDKTHDEELQKVKKTVTSPDRKKETRQDQELVTKVEKERVDSPIASINPSDDAKVDEVCNEIWSPTNTKEYSNGKGKTFKLETMTSPNLNKKQDTPKIDVEISDISKNLDAAEDSDNSQILTEPPSPNRPDASEVRGKKKSRGRPPSSARRRGRKIRAHPDGEETDAERRPSDSLLDVLDDAREEACSETAESEETERPSESDRDDASSIVAGSYQQSLFVDSLPGSPSSVTEHEHDHTYRIWRKAIMLVWRTIASHKYANIFLHPVTNDIAPGYCGIVQRPMNLTKIKKNIENGTIRTTEQFHRDIMLMFQNAIMYNNRDHDVFKMAAAMQNDAVQYIEEFISTQLMVQQPDSVKMLRSKDTGARRLDTAATAKEDTEKQRRGSAEAETSGKKRRTRADE